MSFRGRGTLEVKKSSNPFFQTTNSNIGVNPHERTDWTGDVDPAMLKSEAAAKETFSFLYTRESDVIGSQVPKPTREEKSLLTKTEFLKKRRAELRTQMLSDSASFEETSSAAPMRVTAEDMLKVYKHEPKSEDPRFMTTSVRFRSVL